MDTTRRKFLVSSSVLGAALVGGARFAFAADNAPAPSDIWEVFRTRRSVRRFKPDPVPDADLARILDAARLAPTSGNQQPWKFLVIRDRAKITALKEETVAFTLGYLDSRKPVSAAERKQREEKIRESLEGYFSAPVYILILTDNTSKYPTYNHWDGPMAAGYLMLAARALGYGTVFLTDSVPDEVTKKVFAIPERYTRVTLTPLGVPVTWPSTPQKKPLSDLVAYETL